MSESTQTLLDAVLKLSEEDRTFVVMRVLESLPDDDGIAMDDEDLEEKLNKRKDDEEGSISWTELRAKLS